MSDVESNKIQEDLERLERKIDCAISRLDDECSRLSNGKESRYVGDLRCRGGAFWGVVLVFGGLIWLADSLGWIRWSMPLGPSLIILAGILILYRCRK